MTPEAESVIESAISFVFRFRGSGSRPMPPEASSLLRGLSSVPGLNPLQLDPELFGARPMPGLDRLILRLGDEEEEVIL